jgi:hypothetical protein
MTSEGADRRQCQCPEADRERDVPSNGHDARIAATLGYEVDIEDAETQDPSG